MKVIERQGTFYLRRHVPARFARIERRREVWLSLGTDSRQEAEAKAPQVWASILGAWEAKLAGDTSDAETRFQAARDLARSRGFRFLPVDRVARLPLDEILSRVEAVGRTRAGAPDQMDMAALLGGAARPRLTVSGALEVFWDITKDRTRGKNANQLRIWRNGRKKAVANFCKVIGDLVLEDISPDDMLDFRDWWWRRVSEDGLTINAANKDMGTLANILKTVNEAKRLGLSLPITGLSFRDEDKATRPSLSADWITTHLLAPGALGGLNGEARGILLGMVNTGYRPSEGAGLLPSHIHLDGAVPYIEILPEGRTLKTRSSKRTIPLAGISLEAFRANPAGFPRYRDSGGLSATVNKFLRANVAMPGSGHTMYGLRHAFEDRLLAAGVDERIRRDLMGHALTRERYGEGASLEHLHQVVQGIAL